jgi:uncharacterized caspase-like protein
MVRGLFIHMSAVVTLFAATYSEPAGAESRMALVIGNSAYQAVSALPNPANDAKAVSELLSSAGFQVVPAANLGLADMRIAIREFTSLVSAQGPDTVALIFFAGHGVQVDGDNYLVPVDARIKREADVPIEALRLTDVMNALSAAPARTRIVILDACRNNAFSEINKTSGRGLAIVDAPNGSIVAYSTAPGAEAEDGSGANSPFTAAFTSVAKEPGLPIELAFKRVRLAVNQVTSGRQTPWESSSLTIDFSFFPSGASQHPTPTSKQIAAGGQPAAKPAGYWRAALAGKSQNAAYELVVLEDVIDGYQEFLALYPTAVFASNVRGILDRRLEMLAWYNALALNSVAAYQDFLAKFPNSDLATTAQRLQNRALQRPQLVASQEVGAARAAASSAGLCPCGPTTPTRASIPGSGSPAPSNVPGSGRPQGALPPPLGPPSDGGPPPGPPPVVLLPPSDPGVVIVPPIGRPPPYRPPVVIADPPGGHKPKGSTSTKDPTGGHSQKRSPPREKVASKPPATHTTRTTSGRGANVRPQGVRERVNTRQSSIRPGNVRTSNVRAPTGPSSRGGGGPVGRSSPGPSGFGGGGLGGLGIGIGLGGFGGGRGGGFGGGGGHRGGLGGGGGGGRRH